MATKTKITYQKSGVDYSQIDPLKILAQFAAAKTAKNLIPGFSEVSQSRGESAHVIDCGSFYLASITECLGTKALVADEARKTTSKTYYDKIAQDTIAMAVNDILTVGALPLSIHAYWAAGDSAWFDDQKRAKDLTRGWEKACNLSGACWAGGETSALTGVIKKNTIDLAASCVGIIKPKTRLILGKKLKEGDAIIFLKSSGIHANGLSLARKIAKKLKKKYATKLPNGKLYGEELLTPTIIYVPTIKALFAKNIDIHYIVNITGHGWRKIMRYPKSFTYRITQIPPVPKVLKFMVKHGPLDKKEAYANLNMGAGFAIFVNPKNIAKTLSICQKNKIKAYLAGYVEKGPKQVIIKPVNIIYKGTSLKVRP